MEKWVKVYEIIENVRININHFLEKKCKSESKTNKIRKITWRNKQF